MATDYPDRYAEFVEVLKEKEFQQTVRNKIAEARRVAAASARQETDVRSVCMHMHVRVCVSACEPVILCKVSR